MGEGGGGRGAQSGKENHFYTMPTMGKWSVANRIRLQFDIKRKVASFTFE